MTSSLAVRVTGLEKRYGGRPVLRGLDLDVPHGSAFGLVGPNGAGKTTFIKLLLGIAHPSAGDISLMGRSPDDAKARRSVGYLPERLTLPDAWTARDHLRAVARIKGASRDEVEQRLEEVALDPAAWRRKLKGFSKGMKQRVGLASALVGSPQLLILDEPTDGIDPLGRIHIRQLLAQRVRQGATVFLNSHLLAETERLCDRVAILGGGRILTSGSLDELRRKEAPVARFAEHPELDTIATSHGLQRSGDTFIVPSDPTPEAMSSALAGALRDGLVLIELSQSSSDLEAVLQDAVSVQGSYR